MASLINSGIYNSPNNNAHISNSSYGSYNTITMSSSDYQLVDFIEFSFKIMGINLTYEDFKQMSEIEKKSLLRDIKINKIL